MVVTNVDTLLQVSDLTVSYGTVVALNNVSFCVHESEIVAMVGPNGAGKSTALKAVSGVLQETGGRINKGNVLFDGNDLKGLRTDQLVAKGISLVPEGRHVFASMTVLENLEMGAYTRKEKAAIRYDIDGILDLFPQLASRVKQKAGTLSVGEQQMLAMGRALMLKPKLLLADEPSLGLSPTYIDIVFDKLIEINESGTSILLVEQNAIMALDVCRRGYVFEAGSIALEGDKTELVQNEEITKAFLGG
jgi:branched-chain amino acid transport system ATP-binding protein